MIDDRTQSDLAVSLLGQFPSAIRASVLENKAFRDRFGLSVDATIRFEQAGINFRRSQLFRAIRGLLSKEYLSTDLKDSEGKQWTLAFTEDGNHVSVSRESTTVPIPEFACLASDSERRLTWFDKEIEEFGLSDPRMEQWRAILQARSLEDDEVDLLLSEFKLAPSFVATAAVARLQRQTVSSTALVPSDIRYYDRLVGEAAEQLNVKEYLASTATSHIKRLVQSNPLQGLKQGLLFSSHPFVGSAIPLRDIPKQAVLETFDWLEKEGDRFSQLGAIECGLAHLEDHPDLEPYIAKLVRQIMADDPTDEAGRLHLTCSMAVFADGELARTGICRDRSPYWRRLAAFAHAAVLERAAVLVGMPTKFSSWAIQSRSEWFSLQTAVDMRREPRWIPPFVLPDQLHAELLGRIGAAGTTNASKIVSGELQSLFDGSENSVQSQIHFPWAYLPGPLEGGVDPVLELPAEIESKLRASLDEKELTPKSFALLVNSALIFRIGPSLAQLAAEGLRRVKYQLRNIASQEESFALLNGLATVASVTRSTDLADEVRTFMRVIRRKTTTDIHQQEAMRIALSAAAAHFEIDHWCKFIGDCMTEFAFEDIDLDQAMALNQSIHILCELEPRLCPSTARANAAISALIGSSANREA